MKSTNYLLAKLARKTRTQKTPQSRLEREAEAVGSLGIVMAQDSVRLNVFISKNVNSFKYFSSLAKFDYCCKMFVITTWSMD